MKKLLAFILILCLAVAAAAVAEEEEFGYYPDDYPEADAEICVVGVFDTYQEGEYTYCTLRNASLL